MNPRSLPVGTFLRDYTDYAGRHTDAPPLFHIWTGMALLAAALGNRCWAWAWGRRICANIWVILLAASGILRKTTALNIGHSVLIPRLPEVVWPSEWSFEGLLETVMEQPGGILIVREFKRFFGALERKYAQGVKAMLVDHYDNPEVDSRRTVKDGNCLVTFPAPNLLAATTMEWFEASLHQDDVDGGFIGRTFLIPGTESGEWRGLGTALGADDAGVRDKLAACLENVHSTMEGELDVSRIIGPFNKWLREYEQRWGPHQVPGLGGVIARGGANALKLTMIFQASQSPSLTLSLPAFERAREMVDFTTEQTAQLLSEGLGLSPDAKERRRVGQAIQRAYPEAIERSTLLQRLNISARDLNRHIETLEQAKRVITTQSKPGPKGGRPGTTYLWNGSPEQS